ncbi:MAG: hypothetical protein JW832_04770 [Deltaproteobacteria bacterium]|nr:hypothetical protein [Deltaproteobacteria bacterium]
MQNHEDVDKGPVFSLRDIYFTIFRHQRLIACVAGGIAAVALISVLLFVEEPYESTANILVRTGRESMAVDPTAGANGQRMRSRDEEIRTEMEILKSREVVGTVVESFGMEYFAALQRGGLKVMLKKLWARFGRPVFAGGESSAAPGELRREQQKARDGLINGLMDCIAVRPLRNSSLFRIEFQGPTPEFAQEFLRRLIAVYLDKHSSMFFTDSAYHFLKEKTEKFRRELEKVETDMKEYKNKPVATLIEEQRFLDQFASLQQELQNTESALAASRARAAVLRKKFGAIAPAVRPGAGDASVLDADEVLRRLSALRIQEQELLSTYTEQSIPVREVRRQIRELQNLVPHARATGAMGAVSLRTREGLELELIAEEGAMSSLQAKFEVQEKKLAQLQEQFRDVNENSLVLGKMERKHAALEESYKKFSENLQQARIDQSLKLEKISNITIAQQPTCSLQPIKTKKLLVLLAGVIGGLAAAIALAFLLDSFDDSIKKPEDIKDKLNVRFLASLPLFADSRRLIPEMQELSNLTMVPARKKGLSAPANSSSMVVKYFDALMQRLIFSGTGPQGMPHTIAVTSAHNGEGVSTVAANLAVRLARLGRGHVLLMDMNLLNLDQRGKEAVGRYPDLGNMVALQEHQEAGPQSLALIDRLYLIQYSGHGRGEVELKELQSLWSRDYDFVVIDVPPVLDNAGASFVAQLADKVILVIQAERERWQVLRRALDMLADAHANVVGAILNKRHMYIPGWLYRNL